MYGGAYPGRGRSAYDAMNQTQMNSSEFGPQRHNAATTEEQKQVLKGTDIVPIQMNSTGETEAPALGYPPQLVSNWYKYECLGKACPVRWSENNDASAENSLLATRTAYVPIIHRFVRNAWGSWVTSSFTIQDKPMRAVLDEVFKNYQDLDLDLRNYTFDLPYMPLCHRWDALKQYQTEAKEPTLKNAASALLAFLTPVVASFLAAMAKTRETRKVEFKNLWHLFSPDVLVTTEFYGVQTTCCVKACKETKNGERADGWEIKMKYVDWNGEKSGYTSTSVTIWDYNGVRRVTSLPVFPILFLDDEASYKTCMLERGRKFEQLRGYHFMVANGTKIRLEVYELEQRPIAGKVCIDAYAYYTSCNKTKPTLLGLSGAQENEHSCVTADNNNWDAPHDSQFKAVVRSDAAAKAPAKRVEDFEPLTDEQCLLTTPWVKGFDLKSKDWCELRIDQLQPITWNPEAFEKLILPGDEKQLAWEFVEAKSLASQGDEFDDFIPDKGRGLLILLFGPPGVGKTFTAEAVAKKARVPLYTMSAADIGTNPQDVERELERALSLCRMWNAMLLIDEADVFLAARSSDSIARNELVSIFLRMLEYYQGTLFLTTNCIASVDAAFQSRIDLFLPYYDLTNTARREVWKNFVERAGSDKFDVTDEWLDKLSHLRLNGREIKNLIKSAQLLSLKNGNKVSIDRVYLLAEKRVQSLKVVGESPQ